MRRARRHGRAGQNGATRTSAGEPEPDPRRGSIDEVKW